MQNNAQKTEIRRKYSQLLIIFIFLFIPSDLILPTDANIFSIFQSSHENNKEKYSEHKIMRNTAMQSCKNASIWSNWLPWSACTQLPIFPAFSAQRRTRICTFAQACAVEIKPECRFNCFKTFKQKNYYKLYTVIIEHKMP